MIAYICEQGAKISREGRRLVVTTQDMKRTLFIERLEQLLIFGNVQLTPQALSLLFHAGVDTVFLRRDGRYVGRLEQNEPANIFLRKKQFALAEDAAFCTRTARRIVQGKLLNQATVLARVKRSRQQDKAGEAAGELRQLARKVEDAPDVGSLRGLEGRGAALYFQHLPLAFAQDWGFTRRVRRPPTDPVNAVLSLLYTLLINRSYAAVRIAGLDPYPACLHGAAYGRQSLPLDLVEEFRAILADTLTVALFNMKMLDREDFESPPLEESPQVREEDTAMKAVLQDPLGLMSAEGMPEDISDLPGDQMVTSPTDKAAPGKRPVLLCKEAFKKVIIAFSKKMENEFFHPGAGRQMTYTEAMLFQARCYRRLVEGEVDDYAPLMLR